MCIKKKAATVTAHAVAGVVAMAVIVPAEVLYL